ncbi:LysM peptidoglycan-binding domain-containing protein [Staphylococcus lutrae]|uniref:N-acetylmuramoyl-L-alanine amidase n=1 Tax=Staphylococcus lutrae TaxID=155085 RepID=A0AAC9RRJ8_9STAP|nr:LysM peptidoglycan-binding domain-containing protein [Staphylococcus lutrae]ARJ51013.1 N-acetylmuramoyl-L-alanine amidase [Staphylococcus lutrae]PNZ37151.1 LysM peptidoglycan-binding domain-containing protein [Staphylococcus lutrae]
MRKKIMTAMVGTTAVATLVASHADASTYQVKPGDSLWLIANQFNTTIAQLKADNNLSSNLIFPRQILKVSGSSSTRTQSQSSSSSRTSYYTVRPGDSLSLIASKYGTTYRHIMDLNGLTSFLIFPGQQLKVSGTASTPSKPARQSKPASTSNTSSGNTTFYTVQPGDSLSLIASKYGTTYRHIMDLNGLTSFLIFPGQQLRVSGTAQKTSPTTSTTAKTTTNTGYTSPVFNHANLYDWGQCTWYVFNKRKEAGRGISTYWWNANAWDDNAARDGYTINHSPEVGSILQSDLGYYGHVSYVERINWDGSILVSEMNFSAAPGVLTYRTVPSYLVNSFKYIH